MSAAFDALGPHRGPCGLCGDPDRRHRVADAIVDRVRAGDSEEDCADDFGVTEADVRQLVYFADAPATRLRFTAAPELVRRDTRHITVG